MTCLQVTQKGNSSNFNYDDDAEPFPSELAEHKHAEILKCSTSDNNETEK